jgi:serine/threonine-protein kinase RsbW
MDTTLTVRIGNDPAELARVTEQAGDFLAGHDATPGAAYKVSLALEELVTNTIKYGYDDQDRHEILVSLVWSPPQIVLQLEDDGHPFDPLAAPAPDMNAPLETRSVGGLGLHLVRQMAETFTYRREGGRNRLDLRFSLTG